MNEITMNEKCPIHQVDYKYVPAGVSKKTGKPYNGFWSCPEMGCRQKPATVTPPTPEVKFVAGLEKSADEEKWERIGQEKNRSNLASAMLQSGKWNKNILAEAEKWVLTGKFTEVELTRPADIMKKAMTEPEDEPIDVSTIPF